MECTSMKSWIEITGPADLAWVFDGKSEPQYARFVHQKTRRIELPASSGDFAVATFAIFDDKRSRLPMPNPKFKSMGHTYIRIQSTGDVVHEHNLYLLTEPESMWHRGKAEKTDMVVRGANVVDVRKEYEDVAKRCIEESMKYVLATSTSNMQLERTFGSKDNHYTDLGFSRFSQRRDGHHGIVTVGSAGIPELKEHRVGIATWDAACEVAALMTGYDDEVQGLTPDQKLNVMDNLACGALSMIGCMFQWNDEPFDSICQPSVVLGMMQDCEDDAVSIVGAFNYLTSPKMGTPKTALGKQLLTHLKRMAESMWMAAGYVDTTVADPTKVSPDTISGHAYAIMMLRRDYRTDMPQRIYIVEGTNFFLVAPQSDTPFDEVFGGALKRVDGSIEMPCTYKPPHRQPLARYKTIDVIFSATETLLVGKRPPRGKFIVGLKVKDFIRREFDTHPTAPSDVCKDIRQRWAHFNLAPDLSMLTKLFREFPESKLYTINSGDFTPVATRRNVVYCVVTAYDIHTQCLKNVRGKRIDFPFCSFIMMPWEVNHCYR